MQSIATTTRTIERARRRDDEIGAGMVGADEVGEELRMVLPRPLRLYCIAKD
ncbi:hypothetical protein [Rhodopirellula halodulae]|uniref:hypothetical protein n=1 Tax=Rhodopirellula halodulae TaxID=2894198 RepID=UPI001E53F5B4|nr:hypothetical protein [Rhodopirellula sp. JC737]